MKTILSISLTLLILLTGINVKVASHYCGGQISSVKVSLTGEVASCGMENKQESLPPEGLFSRHCCDDIISSVYISVNYVPASCCYVPVTTQETINPIILSDRLFISQPVLFSTLSGSRKPPGGYNPSDVEQQVICLFQI
jgi:hypothetical protein